MVVGGWDPEVKFSFIQNNRHLFRVENFTDQENQGEVALETRGPYTEGYGRLGSE